jgi:hypothetical protein
MNIIGCQNGTYKANEYNFGGQNAELLNGKYDVRICTTRRQTLKSA